MNFLRYLLEEILRPLKFLLGKSAPSAPLVTIRRRRPNSLFVSIKIPGHLEPFKHGERFEDPLQEALDSAELGEVTGGRTQLSASDDKGRQQVEFCEIELEIYEPQRGIALVRRELARFQVPRGTTLIYELNEKKIEQPVYDSGNSS